MLEVGSEVTASSGTSVVLASGATAGDELNVYAFSTFNLADVYTKAQSDARYVELTGDTMTGKLTIQSSAYGLKLDGTGRSDIELVHTNAGTDLKRRIIRSIDGEFRVGLENDASSSYANHLNIDSAGRVTTPSQPAFSGQKVNTFVTGGAQAKITLDSIAFNTGSNYSTGTGRFTAPVAGKYVVMMNMRKVGSPEPNGYFGCNAKKNGSDASIFTYNDASGYGDDSTWAHMVVDCATSDYFEFYAYPQDSCNITLEVFVYLLG
jgi:hypothetical protein